MSILSNIRDAIQDDGIDCFYPSQHVGKCTKEYVVVKTGGTVSETNVSSERPVYTIMCYVPANKYSRLESMIYDVKQSMKKVFPLVRYVGNETASFYDEDVDAHMISFQYQGCRKVTNW